MDTDIDIILDFLARCGAEVEGRTAIEPPTEEAQLLIRFASGGCSAEERAKACGLIQKEPQLLPWVASRIKALRFDAPPTGSAGDSTPAGC